MMNATARRRRVQELRWEATQAGGGLVFHPPKMVSPYIIIAGAGQASFPRTTTDDSVSYLSGVDGLRYFNPTQDVIIRMPATAVTGITSTVGIRGGRHVRTIGGHLVNTSSTSVFQCRNQTGSAFVEGLLIDGNGVQGDAVVIRWNDDIATEASVTRTQHAGVTLQHCLFKGLAGTSGGVHADGLQSQGPVDLIKAEEVTIECDYQGMFIDVQIVGATRQYVWLRKVNTRFYTGGSSSYIRTLYFYEGDSSARDTDFPVHPWILDQVYADDLSTAPSTNWNELAMFPQESFAWGPTIDTDAEGTFAEFPAALLITGKLRKGQPPGGDFAPESNTGLNYHSPWPVA